MRLLGEEFEKRLPSDLSEAEGEARSIDLLEDDPRLSDMAHRLDQILAEASPTLEDPTAQRSPLFGSLNRATALPFASPFRMHYLAGRSTLASSCSS